SPASTSAILSADTAGWRNMRASTCADAGMAAAAAARSARTICRAMELSPSKRTRSCTLILLRVLRFSSCLRDSVLRGRGAQHAGDGGGDPVPLALLARQLRAAFPGEPVEARAPVAAPSAPA